MFINKLVYATSLESASSPWGRVWLTSTHIVDAVVYEDAWDVIGDVRVLIPMIRIPTTTNIKTKDLTRMWCNCANTYWLLAYSKLAKDSEVLSEGELTPTLTQLCERHKITSESTKDFHWLLMGSSESPPN